MSIDLYEHNLIAYESALSMLTETGKAAIVHPTGTGKSFIGFKLCEDHPNEIICWLSPSEYIFKTQIENLKAASDNYEPDNLQFFTYARLMNMTEDEIAEINPDYIILDEFHRCGAEMWGKGVHTLFRLFPNVPILGLSATNIRYLDNQRDMADELFDGNIASEMTLGEAIVRGILNAPKYVLSIFYYQKDLEKYQSRVRRARGKIVRDTAERYLEELRRTLAKADGLDEIFYKHMTEKNGKYIIFCANKEHMDEMMSHTEWFAKVDKSPRIYSVYSSDPAANKSFQGFKEDNDPEHLRLLYCIDALNEGIHLEDISGVILLRPTVSPIIYKQQIGRALSASKKKNAVIFDIVLNIENLYSIGAIEEEMEIATTYYRYLGEKETIANEQFQVIDEVRDCRILFEKLNDTLTASWDLMYKHAKQYYIENGNLEVSSRYVTADGYSLGKWIFNQRNIRKGLIEGLLSNDQIKKLDSIGMVWDAITDLNWSRNYEAAKQYFVEHGDLNVPAKYITSDGLALGSWLSSLRTWERAGAHSKYLTVERKEQLDSIGMIWDVLNYYWENNYLAAFKYYREHGHLDVPSNYTTNDGTRLGSWIGRLRKLREGTCRGTPLSEEQIKRLDQIGMIWSKKIEHKWESSYKAAMYYVQKNGNLDIPVLYTTEDGIGLGSWIQRQRRAYKNGKISKSRKRKLDSIGMVWDTEPWMSRYSLVKKYYEKHRTIDIPQNEVIEGVWLGKWLATQKKIYENGGLGKEQRHLLSELPLYQVSRKNKTWYYIYDDAVDYYSEYGDLKVPAKYIGKSGCLLADWIVRQRRLWNNGKLSDEQIHLLDEIEFVWVLESVWEEGYRHAKDYFEENDHLDINQSYKCDDGYALGRWVFNYRKAYNGYKSPVQISNDQVAALEGIGMEWKPDSVWDKNFSTAQQYYSKHHTLPNVLDKDDNNRKIAHWINNQRKSFRLGYLTPHKLKKLSKIGITEEWLAPQPSAFEKGYLVAKSYFNLYGNLNVPTNYQHDSGFWLGSWVDKTRKKKNELTKDQIKMLNDIGFVWKQPDIWEEKFEIAEKYYKKHGELPLEPKECKNQDDLCICQWLRRQLLRRKDGKMPESQIERLSAIGMDWLNAQERAWNRGYEKAKKYFDINGNLDVVVSYACDDGYPLGEWLHSQRTHRKRLSPERVAMLVKIGANGMN